MKTMRVVIVIAVSFGLGYYVGQRPAEVKQKLQNLSGEFIEKTIGLDLDRQLILQREFLEAKANLLEGKIHLLNENYQRAAQQLEDALHHLTNAMEADTEGGKSRQIQRLRDAVQEVRERMARGETPAPQNLDDLKEQIDAIRP